MTESEKKIFPTKEKNLDFKNFGLTVHNGGKSKNKSYYTISEGEYSKEESYNPHVDPILTKLIKSQLAGNKNKHTIKSYVTQDLDLTHFKNGGGGGGNGMDKRVENLERKTENIEKAINSISSNVTVLLENQKNSASKLDISELKSEIMQAINLIPKEDNIKQMILKTTQELKIANEDFVEKEISKFSNKNIRWIVGIAISSIAAMSGIVFGFFKLF